MVEVGGCGMGGCGSKGVGWVRCVFSKGVGGGPRGFLVSVRQNTCLGGWERSPLGETKTPNVP